MTKLWDWKAFPRAIGQLLGLVKDGPPKPKPAPKAGK